MAEENKDQQPVDLSSLGGFDFAPAWANGKPDDKSRFARFEPREERADDRRGGERRPFGERKPFGARKPFGERPAGERKPFGERREDRPRFGGPRREDRPPREFTKPLDVDVRILPSQKELGPIIRKIQTTHFAYPLKQLAYLFLDNPAACVLRLSAKKDAAEPVVFHQCKACGFVARTEEEVAAHALAAHLSDYYAAEEIACEPPKGAFACVAKCGFSGVLLGPPNLHGYDARIREMVRTQFPNLTEEAYRARIEMVRDPEAVEAWRQAATKKTVYRRKGEQPAAPAAEGAEGVAAPALEREAAEMEFRRNILPNLLAEAKAVDLSAEVALKSPWRALVFACRDALAREKRFPASLFFALRGAFHHRKLIFFRANDPRGPEFVTSAAMQALDKAHAVPELAAAVTFVEEHPDATRATLPEACRPHFDWLVEKGHLVCFFNGQLAVPADHPKYVFPRRNAPAPTAPVKPVAQDSAAEVPAPAEPASAEAPAEPASAEAPAEPAPAEPAAPVPEA